LPRPRFQLRLEGAPANIGLMLSGNHSTDLGLRYLIIGWESRKNEGKSMTKTQEKRPIFFVDAAGETFYFISE